MKATLTGGKLKYIDDIYIKIKGRPIRAYIMPDISDSKSASYADENSIGRTTPFKNYSYSENRVIQWSHHWIIDVKDRVKEILTDIKYLQALAYPSNQYKPYTPPWIAHIKAGNILGKEELCCVLKSYSIKYPTDVPWYQDGSDTSIPYKVDMELNFEVVYDNSSGKIPYAEDIVDPNGLLNSLNDINNSISSIDDLFSQFPL